MKEGGTVLQAVEPPSVQTAPPPYISACDVLKNPARYVGKPVSLQGRYAWTFHVRFFETDIGADGVAKCSISMLSPLSVEEMKLRQAPPGPIPVVTVRGVIRKASSTGFGFNANDPFYLADPVFFMPRRD